MLRLTNLMGNNLELLHGIQSGHDIYIYIYPPHILESHLTEGP